MSDKAPTHAELLLLCGKVRDDTLTAEDAARLDALLQSSDEAKALYVQYMSVVSLLESRGDGQAVEVADAEATEAIGHDVLAELLQLERDADAELVHQVGRQRSHDHSPWHVGGALRRAIEQPAVLGGIAALLALALVLFAMFRGGPEPTSVAVDPNKPTEDVAIHAVATLTAQHNAQWAERALARGSELHAGQSLTLTAGVAEITTNDGAVAIIEAPASVELIDNNNALRLHSGKLVGICEKPSSKGFLVRTPHMDITDLGTEFGVEVTGQRVAATVFTGTIEVTPPGGTPQHVAANQTANLTINGNNRELVINDQLAEGFETLRGQQVAFSGRLLASGEGLAEDTFTQTWRITAIDGQALDSPLPLRVAASFQVDLPNDMAPAQALRHNPTDGRVDVVYRIETTLRLPNGFDAQREQLAMRFRADNELTSLKVNEQAATVIAQQTRIYGRVYTMVIAGPLKPGDNHLVFEVKNEGINNRQNPVGLQVAWALEPLTTPQVE
jgi:hypothetical protein